MTSPTPFDFKTLWLGRDPVHRIRNGQALISVGAVGLAALVALSGARLQGHAWPLLWGWWLASVAGMLVVYAFVRSGWSRRLDDPSMTEFQMLVAMSSVVTSYPLLGDLRAMSMGAVVLCMAFGTAQIGRAAMLRIALVSVLLLFSAVGFSYWVWPRVGTADQERVILCAGLVGIGGSVAMSLRASGMRVRLKLQRAQLQEALARIEDLAARDALTGLFNRRHANALLKEAINADDRLGHRFSVAMIDLDHFKRINDQHGHGVGDAVLRAFSEAAGAAIRTSDVLARWGGEEFLILLRHPSQRQVPEPLPQPLARLQEAVNALRVPAATAVDSAGVAFTCSIGLAHRAKGESISSLIERADAALYRAKAEGRNRVVEV